MMLFYFPRCGRDQARPVATSRRSPGGGQCQCHCRNHATCCYHFVNNIQIYFITYITTFTIMRYIFNVEFFPPRNVIIILLIAVVPTSGCSSLPKLSMRKYYYCLSIIQNQMISINWNIES